MVIFVILVEKPLVKSYIFQFCLFFKRKKCNYLSINTQHLQNLYLLLCRKSAISQAHGENIKRDRMRVAFRMAVI